MISAAEGLNERDPALASSVGLARQAVAGFATAAGVRSEQLDAFSRSRLP